MNLFQAGDFTLASGAKSKWKIECDALTENDWAALAAMAVEILPPFRWAVGVPRGGAPFARSLNAYRTNDPALPIVMAEDVVTTGGSILRYREMLDTHPGFNGEYPPAGGWIGVCVFARGACPDWVTPLFQMPTRRT